MATVTAHFTLSTPTLGRWCDDCALPSAAEYSLYHVTREGFELVELITACFNASHRGERVHAQGGRPASAGSARHVACDLTDRPPCTPGSQQS